MSPLYSHTLVTAMRCAYATRSGFGWICRFNSFAKFTRPDKKKLLISSSWYHLSVLPNHLVNLMVSSVPFNSLSRLPTQFAWRSLNQLIKNTLVINAFFFLLRQFLTDFCRNGLPRIWIIINHSYLSVENGLLMRSRNQKMQNHIPKNGRNLFPYGHFHIDRLNLSALVRLLPAQIWFK